MPTRRKVLGAGLAAGVVLGGGVGVAACGKSDPKPEKKDDPKAKPRDFATNVAAILAAVGPWPAEDAAAYDSFVTRYMKGGRVKGLDGSEAVLDKLVARLPAGARKLDEITTTGWTKPEVELFDKVLADVYSIAEVRWYMDGIPAPGNCLGPA